MPNEQLRRDEVCEITSSRDRNYWLCTGSVYDLCYKITCDFTVYNNPVNSIRRACEQSRWSVAAGGGVQGGPHGGEGVSGDPAEAGGMRRKPSGGRGIEEGSVGARPGNTAVEGHAGSSVRTLSPRVLHGEGRSGRPPSVEQLQAVETIEILVPRHEWRCFWRGQGHLWSFHPCRAARFPAQLHSP